MPNQIVMEMCFLLLLLASRQVIALVTIPFLNLLWFSEFSENIYEQSQFFELLNIGLKNI